jgi:RNA polymerase sigma factor (sigma-70 family)
MYITTPEQRKRSQVQALATTLYRQRYSDLLRIARRNAATDADAEEALQEAFLSFISHFDPDGPAPAIAWLTLTLKRACWSRTRRQWTSVNPGADGSQLEVPTMDIPPSSTSSLPSERVEDTLEARAQMARLKPDQRKALILLGLGYSYREIGDLADWTYTKVNRCISEGRAALRS